MNFNLSDPTEIRTRVTAVKGRCLNRLTMGPKLCISFSSFTVWVSRTPRVGLEPTTARLTAACSTDWAIEDYYTMRYPLFQGIYPQNHTLYISFIRSYFLCHFWQPKPTWLSPRPISDSQLHMLPCFHLCPIYLVVFKGSYSCDGISHLEGGFTLRCLQRLSLPDLATRPWVWYPTGTPEVSPSRSSRTKDSSSQISYAHAG